VVASGGVEGGGGWKWLQAVVLDMTLTDFYNAVEADPELRGLDIQDDFVVVEEVEEPNWKIKLALSIVLEFDWLMLKDIIMGRRKLDPLYHISRIVGYFSRIENWNVSKIGELADRRAAVEQYAAFDKMGNFEKKGGIENDREVDRV